MRSAVYVRQSQAVRDPVEDYRAASSGFKASFASLPCDVRMCRLDGFEDLDFGWRALLAFCVECDFLHSSSGGEMWKDVEDKV